MTLHANEMAGIEKEVTNEDLERRSNEVCGKAKPDCGCEYWRNKKVFDNICYGQSYLCSPEMINKYEGKEN
jgi:hypothetical protein